jgi:hypothetical protein
MPVSSNVIPQPERQAWTSPKPSPRVPDELYDLPASPVGCEFAPTFLPPPRLQLCGTMRSNPPAPKIELEWAEDFAEKRRFETQMLSLMKELVRVGQEQLRVVSQCGRDADTLHRKVVFFDDYPDSDQSQSPKSPEPVRTRIPADADARRGKVVAFDSHLEWEPMQSPESVVEQPKPVRHRNLAHLKKVKSFLSEVDWAEGPEDASLQECGEVKSEFIGTSNDDLFSAQGQAGARASGVSLAHWIGKRSKESMHIANSQRLTREITSSFGSEMPFMMKAVLCFVGAFPASFIDKDSYIKYRAYQIHRNIAIPIILFCGVAVHLVDVYLLHGHFTKRDAASCVIPAVLVACLCPMLLSFRSSFESTGASFALLHHCIRRGYSWTRPQTLICVGLRAVAVATASYFAVCYWAENWLDRLLIVQVRGEVQQVARFVHMAKPLLAMAWCPMFVSCVVLVYISCDLHDYELKWYANGLAECLINDTLTFDLLPPMTRTEEMVTSRLRFASSSWAAVSLSSCMFMAVSFVVTATQMLTMPLDIWEVCRHSAYLISMLLFMAFLIFPIAQVAETFEYDVLRALNKPSIVHHAQRYFGQQLLSHLHTLNWGFRVGGTMINASLVMRLVTAVGATAVATISQAALQHVAV